jgi:outer membrane protein assembly factor BamB
MRDVIARADYPGLVYSIKDGCDAYHVNGIDTVNAAAAARIGRGVEAGDLLVSLREPSALAIIDKDNGDLKWLLSGRTAAQHSPRFLPDGTIVAFDNLGGRSATGGSRILWIDPATNRSRTVFPRGNEGALLPFFSVDSGAVNVSPDGKRIMVSPSKQGRTIEVDIATGQALWTIDNIMDFSPFLTSHDIKRDQSFARTTANGVYYMDVNNFNG